MHNERESQASSDRLDNENTPFFAKARQRFPDDQADDKQSHNDEVADGLMSPRVAEDITSDEKLQNSDLNIREEKGMDKIQQICG